MTVILSDYTFYFPELLALFRGEDGGGNDQVLEKGIQLFSNYVSSEMEECIQFAHDKNVMIWDYFEDNDSVRFFSDEIQDLWVTFLIQEGAKRMNDIEIASVSCD